jgi:hypothetical protein
MEYKARKLAPFGIGEYERFYKEQGIDLFASKPARIQPRHDNWPKKSQDIRIGVYIDQFSDEPLKRFRGSIKG